MEKSTNTLVRIRRPELTPEERAKRMEAIKASATRLLTAVAVQQAQERNKKE